MISKIIFLVYYMFYIKRESDDKLLAYTDDISDTTHYTEYSPVDATIIYFKTHYLAQDFIQSFGLKLNSHSVVEIADDERIPTPPAIN